MNVKHYHFGRILALTTHFSLGHLCSNDARRRYERHAPAVHGEDLSGWKCLTQIPSGSGGRRAGRENARETENGHMLFTEKEFQGFASKPKCGWSGEIDSGIMLRKPELQLQFGFRGA